MFKPVAETLRSRESAVYKCSCGCQQAPAQDLHAQSFDLPAPTLLLCRRVVYHGPVAEVQQHFQALGFDLPPRMDLPSWLVEITTPSGALPCAVQACHLTRVTAG